MSKTTYTAGVDLFLVDGDIYLVNKLKLINVRTGQIDNPEPRITISNPELIFVSDLAYPITHSTKELEGIQLLDRNRFVKGEDLDELSNEAIPDGYNKFTSIVIREAWKAGYKANKNEFTREEMQKGFVSGMANTVSEDNDKDFECFLNRLRPLSLPSSLTIENNEIIEVKWN